MMDFTKCPHCGKPLLRYMKHCPTCGWEAEYERFELKMITLLERIIELLEDESI
jgi:uncharacterized OB-fold protein